MYRFTGLNAHLGHLYPTWVLPMAKAYYTANVADHWVFLLCLHLDRFTDHQTLRNLAQ